MARVRLYRRVTGIWWGSYTANRRTVRRSTRTTIRAEAERVVATWPLEGATSFAFDEIGLVYFAEAVGAERVKIGWTRARNIEKRLAELQTGCPFPLVVRATLRGLLLQEWQEHQTLQEDWIHGEWFHLSGRVRRRIDEVNSGSP